MSSWNTVASAESVEKTAAALKAHGYEVAVVATGADAKKKALEWIPAGAEVLTVSSTTVDSIGLSAELNDSGKYDSVKAKTAAMDRGTQAREIRKLSVGPDYVVGSVHALAEDGTALIASMTGSQLPAYLFGAGTVVWIVGANKLVKDVPSTYKRLNEHVIDLESKRAAKAYGLPDTFRSFAGKLVLFNKEVNASRIKVILVKEALGF